MNSWPDSSLGYSIWTEFSGLGFKSHSVHLYKATSANPSVMNNTHTNTQTHIHTHIYIYVCIYTYIYRERERERERVVDTFSLFSLVTISSRCCSIPLTLVLIRRTGGLRTFCQCCWLDYQLEMLKSRMDGVYIYTYIYTYEYI